MPELVFIFSNSSMFYKTAVETPNDIADKRRGYELETKLKTTGENTSRRERSKKQRLLPFNETSRKNQRETECCRSIF